MPRIRHADTAKQKLIQRLHDYRLTSDGSYTSVAEASALIEASFISQMEELFFLG